jgi:AraC-like DNA-binding protein
MSLVFEERGSDSPYIESVIRGHTFSDGATIRPAEIHWHMVFSRVQGRMLPIVVGPLKSSGVARWGADAEILWIKFKLGTFLPKLPAKDCLDEETNLPGAAFDSFWLHGATWQFPDFDNVETFVNRLVRQDVLQHDSLVDATLQGQAQALAPRTLRHRFLHSTGLTQRHIEQYTRAQQAAALLAQGRSILDVVHEAGYYDQPHLTRSLKQFTGYTPVQHLARLSQAR